MAIGAAPTWDDDDCECVIISAQIYRSVLCGIAENEDAGAADLG
jgi:hypothetical protein